MKSIVNNQVSNFLGKEKVQQNVNYVVLLYMISKNLNIPGTKNTILREKSI